MIKQEKKGFECMDKGFHITFKNGWTVSVQFGYGNYCENYDVEKLMEDVGSHKRLVRSNDAEVWCWNKDSSKHYPENPLSRQTPLDVLKILNKISKKR